MKQPNMQRSLKRKMAGNNSSSSAPASKAKTASVDRSQATPYGGGGGEVSTRPPTSSLSPQQKCNLIAELSEAILEDPPNAFATVKEYVTTTEEANADENDGQLEPVLVKGNRVKKLLDLADVAKHDRHGEREGYRDEHAARLAMVSLLAVFQDILPSYRIRLPTEAERSVRVSRETKALWDHERALLLHYRIYLKLLERTWENGSRGGRQRRGGDRVEVTQLAATAMLCLAELCRSSSAGNFNFRSNVLAAVVRQMHHRSEGVGAKCCEAVEHVFRSDGQGELALEAARLVAKLVRDRRHDVPPRVVRAFAALPLRVHEDEAAAARIHDTAESRRRKKRDREEAEIEEEMKEGRAGVDRSALARYQSDSLQVVTLAYFRIVKTSASASEDGSKRERECARRLLPAALEGLAKFAHLINIDTVVDLLGVLKQLLVRVDELPLDAALNCILTAFRTLQGPGGELQVDQKEYITPLYNQLPRLCSEANSEHTDITLKCLHFAFLHRREYSNDRVAAFTKRLCTIALHSPAHCSASWVVFVRTLVTRYPAVEQLLENEQDVVASGPVATRASMLTFGNEGVDAGDDEDPEHSNPFATSAWELAALRFHFHPAVAGQAQGCANQKMLQLPREAPEAVHRDLLREAQGGRIPHHRVVLKRHPLRPPTSASGKQDEKRSKRRQQRQQCRFITPRKTAMTHLL